MKSQHGEGGGGGCGEGGNDVGVVGEGGGGEGGGVGVCGWHAKALALISTHSGENGRTRLEGESTMHGRVAYQVGRVARASEIECDRSFTGEAETQARPVLFLRLDILCG